MSTRPPSVAGVLEMGGALGEEARGVEIGGHLGEVALEELVVGQRL